MKPFIPLLLAGLALGCVAGEEPAQLSQASRSRLDEAVAGRTAGPPIACVSSRDLGSSRSLGDGLILFEGPGTLVYVNRSSGGCATEHGRTLVTRTPGAQLCRGDIVRAVDPVSGSDWGSCVLGDFVPWRRTQ